MFADFNISGQTTGVAELMADSFSDILSTLEATFCVLDLSFRRKVSNNSNVGSALGSAQGNTSIEYCQTKGSFNLKVARLKNVYVCFAGILGITLRLIYLIKCVLPSP